MLPEQWHTITIYSISYNPKKNKNKNLKKIYRCFAIWLLACYINLKLANSLHFSSSLSSSPLLLTNSRSSNGASSSKNNTRNFYYQSPSFPIQNASWPFSSQLHTQKQQRIYLKTIKKFNQKIVVNLSKNSKKIN